MKPVIKWSGSKRSQANEIKKYLPDNFDCYYEPFIGGGSMLYTIAPQKSVCGDICEPLIGLWNMIKNDPYKVSKSYKNRWNRLKSDGYQTYYSIRDDFNRTHNPEDLLF